MKLLLVALALPVLVATATAQPGSTGPDSDPVKMTVLESWVHLDGGGAGATIQIDSLGNVHSAGTGGGILLKSYTRDGRLLNQMAYSSRSVSHMVLDPSDDLVLVGRVGSAARMLVMKVRTDGTVVWERVLSSYHSAARVATNLMGEIYVIGSRSVSRIADSAQHA